MKVSDEKLLKAIWIYQLKQVAKGVVQRYSGGRSATCEARDSNFQFASYMWHGEADKMETGLSSSQRRIRINKLIKQGKLTKVSKGFCIRSAAAYAAFESARLFWIEAGIPVYIHPKTAPVNLTDEERLSIQLSCADKLIKHFGEVLHE